jgi:DNA helicase-2/ATP-dependent DNA helicase PcrA
VSFEPSPYQRAIFDWVKDGEGSGIVNAVAGSGKTTSIVMACDYIPEDKRCVFLAFNKSIAVELNERVPDHVEAKTLNALGHRAWVDSVGRVMLDDKKTYNLLKSVLMGHEKRLSGDIKRLVGLAKSFGIAPDNNPRYSGLRPNTYDSYLSLIEHFGLDVRETDEETVIGLTKLIINRSAEQSKIIDFDDQLWLPVISNIPVQRYDWVIVDEAQDLSPVQRKLVSMSMTEGARLLAVGDPYQAIYGFRGAASDSMDRLRKEFGCVEMPLSISYRCPKRVVSLAKTIVPHIETFESAPEGSVTYIFTDEYPYKIADMVICRNAAPLVTLAYELLAKRVPVMMMGRDIGEGLVKLIVKLKPKGIEGPNGLLMKLEEWSAKEMRKAIEKDQDAKAQAIEDKHGSILAFIEGCKATTIPKLNEEIANLFKPGDKASRVVLSTIHKAKGLEADRVFVYRTDLLPSKYAKLEWQKRQEANLTYVAYTRSMNELYLVEEGTKADGREGTADEDSEGESDAPHVCSGNEAVSRIDSGRGGESSPHQPQNVAQVGGR